MKTMPRSGKSSNGLLYHRTIILGALGMIKRLTTFKNYFCEPLIYSLLTRVGFEVRNRVHISVSSRPGC